jgi:MYXO-CTERM domain-containing protein
MIDGIRRLLRCALVALTVLASARPADACSMIGLAPWTADPDEVAADTTPPSALGVGEIRIWRGHANSACEGDSCADMGSVFVELAFEDDRTPPEWMGVRIAVVEGRTPPFLQGPDGTWFTQDAQGLHLAWMDGARDTQEALDFTLELTPIDRAGNAGPSVQVEIHDPGSGGCGTSSGSTMPSWVVLLALATRLLLRRREATHVPPWTAPA